MSTAVQDRDAIASKAIEIVSEEERDAYLAQACGEDAALRRQVEELLAAHPRRANEEKPTVTALPSKRFPHPAGADHTVAHANSSNTLHRSEKEMPKFSRGLVVSGVLVLVAATVASVSVAVWAWRAEEHARKAAAEAGDESKRARKAQEEAEHQRDELLATRHTVSAERDRALAELQAAQRSEQGTKGVLAFLQNKMLSAGRPTGWAEGRGKDVTLGKAVEAAEAKVAEVFADQPLAEAAIREILGSTYLDLGEAALAVQQQERALALREALLGPDHVDTSDSRNKLAVAYRQANRHDDASRLFDAGLPSVAHASALAIRGSMLLAANKPAEAEQKLRECLAIRQKIQPDDWTTYDAEVLLGQALQAQKKYADAEKELLAGYEGLKKREAKIPSRDKTRLNLTRVRLASLYEDWGKKDKAAKWRKDSETR